MFMARHSFLGIAFALALPVGAVRADESVFSGLPTTALRMMQPGLAVEQIIYLALTPIRRYDRDQNGLDTADLDTAQSVVFAKRRAYGLSYYLAMDLNGDLRVTEAEIRTSLLQDVSVAEPQGGNATDHPEIEGRVITVHHGLSKPTVTVTGPRDETRLTRIVIEPGDTPLYVLLTKPEMIWQFEGATSRLKHVVVFTYPQNLAAKARPDKFWSGAGVVGVPKERITFFPEDKCGSQFAISTSPQGKARIGRLVQATGLTAYKSLEREGIVGVALPSGDMLSTADERDYFEINNHLYIMGRDGILEVLKGEAEAEARAKERGIGGGIVKLAPSEVVSSGRVEADPGAKLPQVIVTP